MSGMRDWQLENLHCVCVCVCLIILYFVGTILQISTFLTVNFVCVCIYVCLSIRVPDVMIPNADMELKNEYSGWSTSQIVSSLRMNLKSGWWW